jgi:hypothetical protein
LPPARGAPGRPADSKSQTFDRDLVPTLPNFQKLLAVRRCVWERIIEAMAIPFRGVHKSVEIFLDIDRLEEQAFEKSTSAFNNPP